MPLISVVQVMMHKALVGTTKFLVYVSLSKYNLVVSTLHESVHKILVITAYPQMAS